MKKHLGIIGLMAMSAMMVGGEIPELLENKDEEELESLRQELINEYKLIMQKKSNLSRVQRDKIVWRVDRMVKDGKINKEDLL